MHWFYRQTETEFGPVASSTIQELAACGVITNDTLIRQSDSPDWVAFNTVSFADHENTEKSNPALIQFCCTGCGQQVTAHSVDIGKQAECPSCNLDFTIPAVSPVCAVPPKLPISMPAVADNPARQNQPIHETKHSEVKKGKIKPILIKSGVLLMIGFVGMCSLVSIFSNNKKGTTGKHPSIDSYWHLQQNVMITCNACRGSGTENTRCISCGGFQTVTTLNGYVIVCPQCQGRGTNLTACRKCKGQKVMPSTRENMLGPSTY